MRQSPWCVALMAALAFAGCDGDSDATVDVGDPPTTDGSLDGGPDGGDPPDPDAASPDPDGAVDDDAGLDPDTGPEPDVGLDPDAEPPPPRSATLCDVSEQLFDPHCAGCHNGSVNAYDLRSIGLAGRLLDSGSPSYPDQQMVVPGDPEASFIYQKVVGTQPAGTGGRMPPGGEVPEAADVLHAWIADGADPECDAPAGEVELLDPAARVVRASIALRGVRPTADELDRADELPELIDDWMQTDAFGETIRDMHDEALLLRVHEGRSSVQWKPPLSDEGVGAHETFINDQLQEGPLKLIEYVVREDRPYTEILTADYALGNVTMEGVWGMGTEGIGPEPIGLLCDEAELPGYPGWKRCTWAETDRNGAGVLSSAFFYVRWRSTNANQHRARANTVSRTFLCFDFLEQPVALDEVDIDLADVDAVANAVREVPACVSCHQDLDPIASFMFAFTGTFRPGRVNQYPVATYNARAGFPARGQLSNLREPALFGEPGETIADLGRLVTEHPDFAPCTVRRMYSFLSHTPQDAVPDALVTAWSEAFVQSGYDTKALLKQMVLSDAFNVSHATTEDGAESVLGLKKVRPEQGARMVEALTGFTWVTGVELNARRPYGMVHLMRDARYGYRVLAGGLDGETVVEPAHTYNGPTAAVWRSYALGAADHVVRSDFDLPRGERRLFVEVDADTGDPEALEAQVAHLYRAVLGEVADADEMDAALALLDGVRADDDTRRGWALLLGALLQDLRFTHY